MAIRRVNHSNTDNHVPACRLLPSTTRAIRSIPFVLPDTGPSTRLTAPSSTSTATRTTASSPIDTAYRQSLSVSTASSTIQLSGRKIIDLCSSLSNLSAETRSLGFLEDCQWHHHVSRSPLCTNLAAAKSLVPLKDILYITSRSSIAPKEK